MGRHLLPLLHLRPMLFGTLSLDVLRYDIYSENLLYLMLQIIYFNIGSVTQMSVKLRRENCRQAILTGKSDLYGLKRESLRAG